MRSAASNDPSAGARRSVFDLTPETLRALLVSWGQRPYRAGQILQWVYERSAASFAQMTNLPAALRRRLAVELDIHQSVILRRHESRDGTVKLLLGWPDGATTECVLIPDATRRTACISTQVGCPVGCVFCASGLDGLQRQLTAGQIAEQAVRVRQLLQPVGVNAGPRALSARNAPGLSAVPVCVRRTGRPDTAPVCVPRTGRQAGGSEESRGVRLTHVVFMGLGEPLANYAATVQAVRAINAPWGLGIGARKITVSTVGLPGPMRRLADERMQITLALSLHAPTDELRAKLIPWAKRIRIDSLVEACRYYFSRTGREVTLEYVLLGGVNDAELQARQLAAVARRMRSNVNLIPYNPVDGLPYRRPDDRSVGRFLGALRASGVNAHVRRSRGLDIDGACGQLRRRENAASLLPPEGSRRSPAMRRTHSSV